MAAQGILDFLRGQTCLRQEASYCPVRDPLPGTCAASKDSKKAASQQSNPRWGSVSRH